MRKRAAKGSERTDDYLLSLDVLGGHPLLGAWLGPALILFADGPGVFARSAVVIGGHGTASDDVLPANQADHVTMDARGGIHGGRSIPQMS